MSFQVYIFHKTRKVKRKTLGSGRRRWKRGEEKKEAKGKENKNSGKHCVLLLAESRRKERSGIFQDRGHSSSL